MVEENKKTKKYVTLSDLADQIGNNQIQLATRKKRIRQIIENKNIEHITNNRTWVIADENIEAIKSEYAKRWKKVDEARFDAKAKNEEQQLKKIKIDELKRQLKEQKQIFDEKEDYYKYELDRINRKNDALEDELINSHSDLASAMEKNQDTLQRQQALMARNDQLLTDISNFKSEFIKTNNQYQQAQRQIENHKQEMQQKDKEFAKLKEEKENLQKENERLKNRNLFQRIFNK